MERLGRYELGPLLGRGGFGRVFDAVLHGPGDLQKRVALKILDRGDGLRREARIGGLLRHPNLVDVYEVGEIDGTWFMALERCDASLVDDLPLPPAAVVEVGLQVCAALQYAHETLGLVHQDLKPDNLLRQGAVVKVSDLGLAVAEGFEQAPGVRGTPRYMAPEQRRGGPVDARTDVYALGVLLGELATGRVGLAEPTISFDDDGEAPAEVSVPAWLGEVVARCTAHAPADRYPSAAAVSAALAALRVEGAGLRDLFGAAPALPAAPARDETELFGRDALVEELSAGLTAGVLLTLKGLGGIGKTRVAQAVASSWSGPVAFVDLSPTRGREGLLVAVAVALDLSPSGTGLAGLAAQIGAALALGSPERLVVLDNFEHLQAHAEVVEAMRGLAPSLRVLVTSRSPIGLPGETVVEVPPLDDAAAVEVLSAVARTRGVDVTGDPAVAELAQRLSGVPLALRLAAGRVGVLSPSDVLERLDLALLRSGEDTTERHASLEAALEWSWQTLDELQRRTLAQLLVFRSPFGPEAVEALVALPEGSPWVLDVLDILVDRSLVSLAGDRLRLLQPVRDFLEVHTDAEVEASRRHGRWFARLGSQSFQDDIDTHGGASRLQQVASVLDDVLAANERALLRRDPEIATATALAAARVYLVRGPLDLGVELIERTLGLPGVDRAPLLRRLASLQLQRGEDPMGMLDEARALFLASGRLGRAQLCLSDRVSGLFLLGRYQEIGRELQRPLDEEGGLPQPRAVVMRDLQRAVHARAIRQPVEARGLLERVIHLSDRFGLWRQSIAGRINLATVLADMGEVELSLVTCQDARALVEQTGFRRMVPALTANLGALHAILGEVPEACRLLVQAIDLARTHGLPEKAVYWTAELCGLLAGEGDWTLAASHVAEGRALAEASGGRASRSDVVLVEAELALRRGRLAEAEAAVQEAEAHRRQPWHSLEIRRVRAVLLRLQGEPELALAALTGPDDSSWEEAPAACVEAAQVHLDRGEPECALAWCDRMLALRRRVSDPLAMALALRGLALHRLGQEDAARDAWTAALAAVVGSYGRLELLVAMAQGGNLEVLDEAWALVEKLALPPAAPTRRALEAVGDQREPR